MRKGIYAIMACGAVLVVPAVVARLATSAGAPPSLGTVTTSTAAASPGRAGASRDIESLRAQVERLEADARKRATLERRVGALSDDVARLDKGAEDPASDPAGEPSPAAAGWKAEDMAAALDVQFDEERRELDWSAPTERAFEKSFAGVGEKANLESLECRATMCRLVVRFTDAMTRSTFLFPPPPGPLMAAETFLRAADDGVSATLYVARTGHPLNVAPM